MSPSSSVFAFVYAKIHPGFLQQMPSSLRSVVPVALGSNVLMFLAGYESKLFNSRAEPTQAKDLRSTVLP